MANPPVVIRAHRGKALKLFLIAAAFIAGCALMLRDGHNVGMGVAGILFFGIPAIQSLVALIVPPRLVVDDDGLHWHGLRGWHLTWAEIARFRIVTSRNTASVAIDYRDTRQTGAVARLRRPKTIPSILWMKPYALQDMLQARLVGSAAAPDHEGAASDEIETTPEPVTVMPWFSIGLLAALVLVFAAKVNCPVTPQSAQLQPSVVTLIGFGGLSRDLLFWGGEQWYRVVASPFLHGSLMHLLGNGVALLMAGRILEGVIGRLWFAAIYAVGALAGAGVSLLLNGGNIVSVGASGAILSLFAAALVCSFHFRLTSGRQRLQTRAFSILIPTLLSLNGSVDGMKIDFGDHLGGAIGGALMGLILLRGWAPQASRPPRQRWAMVTASLAGLACAGAVWPAVSQHRLIERAALLVPDATMPKEDEAVIAQASDLLRRYPSDPRLHLAMAVSEIRQGDPTGAEREAREGLRLVVPLRHLLTPGIEASLWMVLGESLARRDADGEARTAYDKAATLDPKRLALDYDRARLDLHEGSLDLAFNEATRVTTATPSAPAAWGLLGDIDMAKADPAAALVAYDKVERLKPSAMNERLRGLARFYAGDRSGALVDLDTATRLDPDPPYGAIWLSLARQRQGYSPGTLSGGLSESDAAWPAPVIRLFLGTTDTTAVLAKAQAGADQGRKYRLCEAGFYIAEWKLLHDQPNEADDGFRKAVQDCPPRFVETWMASNELKQGAVKPQ